MRSEDTPIAEAVGRRILDARAEQGLFAREVAAKAGVTKRTMLNLENGQVNCGFVHLLRVWRALGLPADELFEGW